MNITDITKQAGANKKRKRIGRGAGSGNGKTAGRGHNGAKSRAGSNPGSLKEGGQMQVFRLFPKRGFSNAPFKTDFYIVNVGDLNERYSDGDHVTAESLVEKRLIRNTRLPLKVLGTGDLSKKLNVDADKFSKSAEQKITAAGGQVQWVGKFSRAEDKPAKEEKSSKSKKESKKDSKKGQDASE